MRVGTVLIVWLFLYITPMFLISPWTWRSIDFWVEYAKQAPYDTPYLVALLASLFWPFMFFVNVVSEIARLFV